jgi:hypothetical protein
MGTKQDWPDRVKIWELYYLKKTAIDRIRQELSERPDGVAPSWDTVNRVVNEFLFLTRAQVRQLSDVLQERWRELQSEAEQEAPKDGTLNPRLLKHFDDLAEVAKTLYEVQQYIFSYDEGETFKVIESPFMLGFFSFQPPPKKQPLLPSFVDCSVSIDCPEVEYFFEHLRQEFAKLSLKGWKELITAPKSLPQDVIDRIRSLGNTARFTFCPNCQVCKDLMA